MGGYWGSQQNHLARATLSFFMGDDDRRPLGRCLLRVNFGGKGSSTHSVPIMEIRKVRFAPMSRNIGS
jgi:hypothetical protein